MNQFFYKRKESTPQPEGESIIKEYNDSLNINKVIRSIELSDGKRLVILDDFHEEVRQTPILNKKNEITGAKNERATYQSEIYLEVEDGLRFVALLNKGE